MTGAISSSTQSANIKGVFSSGNREKERKKRQTSKGSLSKGQKGHSETGPETSKDKSW